jgi:hypothetical protein
MQRGRDTGEPCAHKWICLCSILPSQTQFNSTGPDPVTVLVAVGIQSFCLLSIYGLQLNRHVLVSQICLKCSVFFFLRFVIRITVTPECDPRNILFAVFNFHLSLFLIIYISFIKHTLYFNKPLNPKRNIFANFGFQI